MNRIVLGAAAPKGSALRLDETSDSGSLAPSAELLLVDAPATEGYLAGCGQT
jgi:hypothetical protein